MKKNSFINLNKDILEITHSQLPQAKVLACISTTYFETITVTDTQGRENRTTGTYISV